MLGGHILDLPDVDNVVGSYILATCACQVCPPLPVTSSNHRQGLGLPCLNWGLPALPGSVLLGPE